MQSVESFKQLIQLSDKLIFFFAQKGLSGFPFCRTGIKTLSDFLEDIPRFCDGHDDLTMPMCLLIKHTGEETFKFIPIGACVNTLFPYEGGKSIAEIEELELLQKNVASGMMRSIIQMESVDEYIFSADTRSTNPITGENREAILLIHSDSPTSEMQTWLPYTRTEVGSLVFGKGECQDSSTGRFNRLREPQCR